MLYSSVKMCEIEKSDENKKKQNEKKRREKTTQENQHFVYTVMELC